MEVEGDPTHACVKAEPEGAKDACAKHAQDCAAAGEAGTDDWTRHCGGFNVEMRTEGSVGGKVGGESSFEAGVGLRRVTGG